MEIYTDYLLTTVGYVQMKATNTELIEVYFTDNVERVVCPNDITNETKKQLIEYFDGKRMQFQLPLRLHGTPFQVECLKALLRIPYGKTISYKEEAQMIGREKAVRAVGNANRVNKIGIIIPCHRVIGSDGSLVGYAGRLDLKAWLLEHERHFSQH